MEQQFSIEQSFAVIKQVIAETRMRFQQNGWLFIFWGLVISVVSFGYYFLLKAGVEKAYLINWLYLLAAILTFVYFFARYRNKVKSQNYLVEAIGWMWLIINLNIFVIGFAYHDLEMQSVFIIMMIVSIGYFVSGLLIRSWILALSALIMNLSSYFILHLKSFQQLLLFIGFVALICIFIPGVYMEIKKQRQ